MPKQGLDVIGCILLDDEWVVSCVWFDPQSGWLLSSRPSEEQMKRLTVSHWMPLPETPNV